MCRSPSRLLKKAHLRRFPCLLSGRSFVACALKRFGAQAALRRTSKYASLLMISGALHLGIFEQPEKNDFFSTLIDTKAIRKCPLKSSLVI
jgi:hypothetical protein